MLGGDHLAHFLWFHRLVPLNAPRVGGMTARPLYDLLPVLDDPRTLSEGVEKSGGDTCRLILTPTHQPFVTSAPVKPFSHKARRIQQGEAISSRKAGVSIRYPSLREKNRSFNLDFRQFYGSTSLNLRVSMLGVASDRFGDH